MNSADLTQAIEEPSYLAATSVRALQKKTVLLVEDEAFLREITCDVLDAAGFAVFVAGNSGDAMTLFRKHRTTIDLLISDVALPGSSGYDLAREMRKSESALGVVLISGHIWTTVARNQLREKQMFYLPKPFSAADLLGKIEEVLHRVRRCI
jgi:DNA-binding response OmpR family regulator